MLWIFTLLALIGHSLAWPVGAWADTALGFDLTTDYVDGYLGPWSADYLRGSRWMGLSQGPRGLWPYAPPYGDYAAYGDWMNPMDYMYAGGYPYPRTTDVSKEKYVRDSPYGETEVGVRDSVSVLPGVPRPGLSRYALPPVLPRSGFRSMDRYLSPYGMSDFDLPFAPSGLSRRMFAAGMGTPRASSLRTGGDFLYLRR